MYATFSSSGFSDLSNVRFSKKIDLYLLFCFDRFLPIFAFASKSLSFGILLRKRVLKEVVTVANVLIGVRLVLKLNQVDLLF